MERFIENQFLNWAQSARIGSATEVAVMAPIRRGRVPGERRTFEERLRFVVGNIDERVRKGRPIELSRLSTIHFGRMIIIRPEQYLLYSKAAEGSVPGQSPGKVPAMDEFVEEIDGKPSETELPEYASWLLTLVNFDGDLKVYFREIAEFVESDFDKVFDNCEDFPGTGDFEKFWGWIRRYQLNTDFFFSAYPELSVARIKELEDFRARFDAFVASVRPATGDRPQNLEDLFDRFLLDTRQYATGFPAAGGVYLTKAGK